MTDDETDDRTFQIYVTSGRGVNRPKANFNLLNLTPFGLQET